MTILQAVVRAVALAGCVLLLFHASPSAARRASIVVANGPVTMDAGRHIIGRGAVGIDGDSIVGGYTRSDRKGAHRRPASNNDRDMFEAIRQAAFLQKLSTGDPRAELRDRRVLSLPAAQVLSDARALAAKVRDAVKSTPKP